MGSATVDFTETGKSAKYKAYVYDSCGNEESGSWAGTACTDCGSFTSSGHVITITGPSKEVSPVLIQLHGQNRVV